MREDNAELSQTVTYTYDKGGNITEKTVYPFTTGTPATATDTIAYTYDSTWKDMLASYDGEYVFHNEIRATQTDWNMYSTRTTSS